MSYSKEYHINNSIVRIIIGNILDSRADVIVSSDDSNITMRGGVSMAIQQQEGSEAICLDVKKCIPAAIGDVVVSTAGSLPQKYIFHVITIDEGGLNQLNLPEALSKTDIHKYIIGHSIDKCFRLLHALDMKSIAFPAIGAGMASIPYEKVAVSLSEAIARNLRKTNKAFTVELYLLDNTGKQETWDFLPMFEQFSAREAVDNMMEERFHEGLGSDGFGDTPSEKTAPDANKDIFISYSRKDKEFVQGIYTRLEKAGLKCWLDTDGMFSGVSFKKVIVDAIKQARLVLFISSKNSNTSRNVVSEISLAMKYEKKIIPVRLDMTPYSESIEYDLINHDFVVYDLSKTEDSNRDMLKKIVSTLEMQ